MTAPRALRTMVGLLALLAAACGGWPAAPRADDRPVDYAGTAIALSNPPTATPRRQAPPVPTVGLQGVAGRVVLARGAEIELVESGSERTLFRAPADGMVKDPALSPDGGAVAFAYAPPVPTPATPTAPGGELLFTSDLMLVDAGGGNVRVAVAHDGPGAVLESPRWSPAGDALYYGYSRPNYQNGQVVGATLEVRRSAVTGGAPTTVVGDAGNPALSADGRWLAFVGESDADGESLRLIATTGGEARVLVPAGDRFSQLLAPRFSPDGATVAFSAASYPAAQPSAGLDWLRALAGATPAFAHGVPWDVWAVPAAGGQARRLTWLSEDTPYAAWSADGKQLLVYAVGGLYQADPLSGDARVVTRGGSHGGMDWRP